MFAVVCVGGVAIAFIAKVALKAFDKFFEDANENVYYEGIVL